MRNAIDEEYAAITGEEIYDIIASMVERGEGLGGRRGPNFLLTFI
jgi:hypothetical protein